MATVYILYTHNFKHIKQVLAELDFRAGIIIRAIESTVLRGTDVGGEGAAVGGEGGVGAGGSSNEIVMIVIFISTTKTLNHPHQKTKTLKIIKKSSYKESSVSSNNPYITQFCCTTRPPYFNNSKRDGDSLSAIFLGTGTKVTLKSVPAKN